MSRIHGFVGKLNNGIVKRLNKNFAMLHMYAEYVDSSNHHLITISEN